MMKHVGLDKVVDSITEKLGKIQEVHLVGDYAERRDTGIIDLFILASELNLDYLMRLLEKAEHEIDRKLRFVHFRTKLEIDKLLDHQAHLLIWEE